MHKNINSVIENLAADFLELKLPAALKIIMFDNHPF